jgi:DNA repair protein RecN (Recombination protein N)
MLQFLRIRNLALLAEIELEFESGFTAVTGETGAGKSILLGALGLLAGARADKTVIRQGADACEVEAGLHFKNARGVDALLETLGLPACEEGLLVLKRAIPREKAPRITVNGSVATLANLQALGELWIDFHGPGEPRRLLKADCQIELLDLFGQLDRASADYRTAYDAWRGALAEIDRLTGETQLAPDQIDFLRHQIATIDALDLTPEGIEALERDFTRQSRSQELASLGSELAAGLHGDDGILRLLGPLVRTARQLGGIDLSLAPLVARLESLAVEAEDLGREFEAFAGGLEFDAESAAKLQEQMDGLLDLKRKYGRDGAAIRAAREDMARRVAEQGDLEGTLARLQADAAKHEKRARALAADLRVARERAGKTLTQRAGKILVELGFKKAELRVSFSAESELRPHGDARPEFLFSPNVGEAPLPLARIASSGELARVMLALKTVLAEVDDIPVLVFDEVDANVGGEIGRVVGEKMAAIAKKHQVLCVTHLPQVASLAAQHLVVEKGERDGRASVDIRAIHDNRKHRLSELARMLGDRAAKSALAHAEELLAKA